MVHEEHPRISPSSILLDFLDPPSITLYAAKKPKNESKRMQRSSEISHHEQRKSSRLILATKMSARLRGVGG